jgi:hypothetical protein
MHCSHLNIAFNEGVNGWLISIDFMDDLTETLVSKIKYWQYTAEKTIEMVAIIGGVYLILCGKRDSHRSTHNRTDSNSTFIALQATDFFR